MIFFFFKWDDEILPAWEGSTITLAIGRVEAKVSYEMELLNLFYSPPSTDGAAYCMGRMNSDCWYVGHSSMGVFLFFVFVYIGFILNCYLSFSETFFFFFLTFI